MLDDLKKVTSTERQRKDALEKVSIMSPPLLTRSSIPYWASELKTKWHFEQSFTPAHILEQLTDFYKLQLEELATEHHLLFVKWSKLCASSLGDYGVNSMKQAHSKLKKHQDFIRSEYLSKLLRYRQLSDAQFKRQERKRALLLEKEEWTQKFASYRESANKSAQAARDGADTKSDHEAGDATALNTEDTIEHQKKSWLQNWKLFLNESESAAEHHNAGDAMQSFAPGKRNWSNYIGANYSQASSNVSGEDHSLWANALKDEKKRPLWRMLEKQPAEFSAADVEQFEGYLKSHYEAEKFARCFVIHVQTMFESDGYSLGKDYLFLKNYGASSEMDPALPIVLGYGGIGRIQRALPLKCQEALEFIDELADLAEVFKISVSIDMEDGRPFSYMCQQIFTKLFRQQANDWLFLPADPDRAAKWIELNANRVVHAKDETSSIDWAKQLRVKPFPKACKTKSWKWWHSAELPDWLEQQRSQLCCLDSPKNIDYELAFELDILRSTDAELVQVKLRDTARTAQRIASLLGREKQTYRHYTTPELGDDFGLKNPCDKMMDSISRKRRQIEASQRDHRTNRKTDANKGKSVFSNLMDGKDARESGDPKAPVNGREEQQVAQRPDVDEQDQIQYAALINSGNLYTPDFFYEHEIYAASQLEFLFAQQQRWRLLHQLNYIHHLVLHIGILHPEFELSDELLDTPETRTDAVFDEAITTQASNSKGDRSGELDVLQLYDKNDVPFVYDEALIQLEQVEKELLLVGSTWILKEANVALPSIGSTLATYPKETKSTTSGKGPASLDSTKNESKNTAGNFNEEECITPNFSGSIPGAAGSSFSAPHLSRQHLLSKLYKFEVRFQAQKIELVECMVKLLENTVEGVHVSRLKALVGDVLQMRPHYAWDTEKSFEKSFALQTYSLQLQTELMRYLIDASLPNNANQSEDFCLVDTTKVTEDDSFNVRSKRFQNSCGLVVYIYDYLPVLVKEMKLLIHGRPNSAKEDASSLASRRLEPRQFSLATTDCIIWAYINNLIKRRYLVYPALPAFPQPVPSLDKLPKSQTDAEMLKKFIAEQESYPASLYLAIKSLWTTLAFQRLQSSHVQTGIHKEVAQSLLRRLGLYQRIPFNLAIQNKLSCSSSSGQLAAHKAGATAATQSEASQATTNRVDPKFDAGLDPEDLSDFVFAENESEGYISGKWAASELFESDLLEELPPHQIARLEVAEFALWKVLVYQLYVKQSVVWQEALSNLEVPESAAEYHSFLQLEKARENVHKRQQSKLGTVSGNAIKLDEAPQGSHAAQSGRLWLTDVFNPAQTKKFLFNVIRQALDKLSTQVDKPGFIASLITTGCSGKPLTESEREAVLQAYCTFLFDLYTDTASDLAMQLLCSVELVQQTRQQQLSLESLPLSNLVFGKNLPGDGLVKVYLSTAQVVDSISGAERQATGSTPVPPSSGQRQVSSNSVVLFSARDWFESFRTHFQFTDQLEQWTKIVASSWSFKPTGHIETTRLGTLEASRLLTLQQLEFDLFFFVQRFAQWLKRSKHVFGQMKAVRELDYVLFEMQKFRNEFRKYGDTLRYDQFLFNIKKVWKRQYLKMLAMVTFGGYSALVTGKQRKFNFSLLEDNASQHYQDFIYRRVNAWKFYWCGPHLHPCADASLSISKFRVTLVDSCTDPELTRSWLDGIWELEELVESSDKKSSTADETADLLREQMEFTGNLCQLYRWRKVFIESDSGLASFYKEYSRTIMVDAVKAVCHLFHELSPEAGAYLLSHPQHSLGHLIPKGWKAGRETLLMLQKCELRLLSSFYSLKLTQKWKTQLDAVYEQLEDEKNNDFFAKGTQVSLSSGFAINEAEFKDKRSIFERAVSSIYRAANNTTRSLRPLLLQANELLKSEDQVTLAQFLILPRAKLGDSLLYLSQELAKWKQPPVFGGSARSHQTELSQDLLTRVGQATARLEQQLRFSEQELVRERQNWEQHLRIEAHYVATNWYVEMGNLSHKLAEVTRQKAVDEKRIRNKVVQEYDELVSYLVQQNTQKDYAFEEFKVSVLGKVQQTVLEQKREQLKLAADACKPDPIADKLVNAAKVEQEKIELEQAVADYKQILLKQQCFGKLKDAAISQYYQKQLSRVTFDLANAEQKLWASYRENEAHEAALRKQLNKLQKEYSDIFQDLKGLRIRHADVLSILKSLQQQQQLQHKESGSHNGAPTSPLSAEKGPTATSNAFSDQCISTLTRGGNFQAENTIFHYQLQLGKYAEEIESKSALVERMLQEKKESERQQSTLMNNLKELFKTFCSPIVLEEGTKERENEALLNFNSLGQAIEQTLQAADHFQNTRDREIRYLSKRCRELEQQLSMYNKFDGIIVGDADEADSTELQLDKVTDETDALHDALPLSHLGPLRASTRNVNFQLPPDFESVKFERRASDFASSTKRTTHQPLSLKAKSENASQSVSTNPWPQVEKLTTRERERSHVTRPASTFKR